MINFPFFFSDYRVEYDKLRKDKELSEKLKAEETLTKISEEDGLGRAVPFVTELSQGRNFAEIYLKHPGNESSDDEEGVENSFKEMTIQNDTEENDFNQFVSQHKTATDIKHMQIDN